MAISAVEICNNALIKLGSNTITSLTDDTKPARLCNKMYTIMRDDLLRAHPWNFAIARATLAQLEAKPAFGFSFQYQLPSDSLRVLKLNTSHTPYRIEGRKLLTDSNTVELIYIKRVTDEAQFDSNYSNILALRIAAQLAYVITNSVRLAESIKQEFRLELNRAKMNDAQEDSIHILQTDTFTSSHLLPLSGSIIFESTAS